MRDSGDFSPGIYRRFPQRNGENNRVIGFSTTAANFCKPLDESL
jgi:hypothetical protein